MFKDNKEWQTNFYLPCWHTMLEHQEWLICDKVPLQYSLRDSLKDLEDWYASLQATLDFIETQIAQAEEIMKKKLISELPIALRKHSHVWTIGSIQETIVNSISSL